MNNYQRELCRQIQQLLSSKFAYDNIKSVGINDAFNALVRHFPEVTSEGKKAYKKVELYKKHHRVSVRAARIIDDFKGAHKDLVDLLHSEHATPVSVLKSELLSLGFEPNLSGIERIMNKSEVVILSKDEKKVLDGSPSKKFILDDSEVCGLGMSKKGSGEERLNALGVVFDERYAYNKL